MNRLTKRTKGGIAYTEIPLNQSTVLDEKGNIIGCRTGFIADRLAAYEDTGLQPEHIDSIIEQLLGYLDAEQAGLLIDLPCKIGDTVYQINYDRTIENYKVIGFEIDERGQLYVRVLIERPAATLKLSYRKEDLYFSREEAEKALEEKGE